MLSGLFPFGFSRLHIKSPSGVLSAHAPTLPQKMPSKLLTRELKMSANNLCMAQGPLKMIRDQKKVFESTVPCNSFSRWETGNRLSREMEDFN